jgi:hypothetical protein
MKTKLFLYALLSAAALTSCDVLSDIFSPVDCPGFPDYLVDYFPYKGRDNLRFVNQNGDTTAFKVHEVWQVKPHAESHYLNCNSPVAEFILLGRYRIDGGIDTESKCIYISVNWTHGARVCAGQDKDAFNPKDSLLFGKTVVLESQDTKSLVNRIVIIKGKGIVEFYDGEEDYLWKKINE